MKRGQTQQIFVWILVLVVAVSILFFGIKLIKKSEGLKDEALIVRFFDNLDKKLSQYYYLDKGSSGEEKFLLPNDVKEVCFINSDISVLAEFTNTQVDEDKKDYFFQLKDFSDVFILPNNLYQGNRYNLTMVFTSIDNPKCLNVANGILTVNLENKGVTEGVEIK